MAEHACEFPEVIIEEGDFGPDDPIKAGMKVLIPCPECGETPLDSLELLHTHTAELQTALLRQEPNRPLYHWAPVARRKQIMRYGLLPGKRPTTSSGGMGAPCVCLGDSPSWAWALSGGMPYTPDGEWDLWQTWLEALDEPVVLADHTGSRPSGIYEVRTEKRIYKRNVWWVGSRLK
jgi:hypothetical protein